MEFEYAMSVQIETIRSFVTEAEKVYRDCYMLLGRRSEAYSFEALVWAARRGEERRRGQVARSSDGSTITFHIHGNGYTLNDSVNDNEYRFDARNHDGGRRN